MQNSEQQLEIIKDIILPVDFATRYDIYFTDKRIAIVSMGTADRADYGSRPMSLVGVAPAPLYTDDKKKKRQIVEEQIKSLPLDEILKLSKKNCFYTYNEIEEVKLIPGKRPKFAILSNEYESKFSPNQEQFRRLNELLPTIEMLKDKISVYGTLKSLHEEKGVFCRFCGHENDSDAIYCETCGKKMKEETTADALTGVVCSSCGAKNKAQASFCKKCGTPILLNE